jgi:hypothetical protein
VRVRLRLVVGEEDDVLTLGQLVLDLGQVVRADDLRVLPV